MGVILYFILMLTELFILIGVSIYGVGLIFSSLKGAPYVPTSKKELTAVLEKGKLKKGTLFVELGSGDGRVVRQAVKDYGVMGVGIEINPLLVWWSRFLSKRDGTARSITFLKTDVFKYSLTNVDYLYLFLMPELLAKLIPKFKKELKKGTLIISHGFMLIGLEKKLIATNPSKSFSTYYYKV